MAGQSKDVAAPSKVAKQLDLNKVHASIFLSITTSCAALQAEPILMARLCGGDVARSAVLLSSSATVSGLLGLLVNQAGGRMSDAIGRKPLFYVGPLFSLLQGLAVFANARSASPSLALLLVSRTLRLCLGTFSSSVMCMASLSDLAEGKQLSIANSVLWACSGLGVIVGPLLEGTILGRGGTGGEHVSYLLTAVVAGVHCLFTAVVTGETLPTTERKSFTMQGFNPLGFMKLFRPSTPSCLKKLVLVASLQSFLEVRMHCARPYSTAIHHAPP
jgi:MFS family permease